MLKRPIWMVRGQDYTWKKETQLGGPSELELTMLEKLTELGSTCTPKLLDYHCERQIEGDYVPKGFILYMLIEKLPGQNLMNSGELPKLGLHSVLRYVYVFCYMFVLCTITIITDDNDTTVSFSCWDATISTLTHAISSGIAKTKERTSYQLCSMIISAISNSNSRCIIDMKSVLPQIPREPQTSCTIRYLVY